MDEKLLGIMSFENRGAGFGLLKFAIVLPLLILAIPIMIIIALVVKITRNKNHQKEDKKDNKEFCLKENKTDKQEVYQKENISNKQKYYSKSKKKNREKYYQKQINLELKLEFDPLLTKNTSSPISKLKPVIDENQLLEEMEC